MEKANNEKIKEIFLAVFVLLCVGLILTLWTNAFVEKDAETPYFYRGVPALSASYYATRTAVAEQIILGTVEPTVEKKHKEPSVNPFGIILPSRGAVKSSGPRSPTRYVIPSNTEPPLAL